MSHPHWHGGISAVDDGVGRTVLGKQDNATVVLGVGDQTITLIGTNEVFSATPDYAMGNVGLKLFANDTVFGPTGSSTISVGDGYHAIVLSGSKNIVAVGNGGTVAGPVGKLSFINAGTGNERVTAGDGTHVIDTGGYGDTITVGNGLNLIFATDLTANAVPYSAQVGFSTLTLGGGNNFAYLHGGSNTIVESGGVDAIWGGTAGGDRFVLAPAGGVLFVENFGPGDTLDLSKILAGAPMVSDLSNIGTYVKVVGNGPDDAVFGVCDGGSRTVLQVLGPKGTAYVNLENVGSLSVAGLSGMGALTISGTS